MHKYCLTIDPGWNFGVVLWIDGKIDHIRSFKLTSNQLKTYTYLEKINDIHDYYSVYLQSINQRFKISSDLQIIIEGVSLWGNSLKSQVSAKRGDTFNLAYLIGYCLNTSRMYSDHISIIDVRKWKGQMSDKVLFKRVRTFFHDNQLDYLLSSIYFNEHTRSAIGIGMDELGLF